MTDTVFIPADFYKGPSLTGRRWSSSLGPTQAQARGEAGCHSDTAVSGKGLCGWHGEREK